LPTSGKVFVSVANRDKRHIIFQIKRLADLGFEILATYGTAAVLRRNGVDATVIRKLHENPAPGQENSTIVEKIFARDVGLIINTPHGITTGANARIDGYEIRTAAVAEGIPCITTVQGLAAAVQGIEALIAGNIGVRSLQSWGEQMQGHIAEVAGS
ncbi:MAG: carB, partial [Nocardioidaceae bacterium]|nr:carB [Nocardioidaceae bacterium]